MEKALIRKEVLDLRSALSSRIRADLSGNITERAIALKEIKSAKTIAAFLSLGNEVDTRVLIQRLLEMGKTICVPVIEQGRSGPALKFVRLHSLNDEFVESQHGVKEPVLKKFVAVKDIGLFFVPGIAFDGKGARLGWGNGYYDKFFGENKPHGVKVGLAYGFQVVADIPMEKHDVLMDAIVTEDKVARF